MIVRNLFILTFCLLPFIIQSQSDRNCNSLKRKVISTEKKIHKAFEPVKKLEAIELFLSKYNEWEECTGVALEDIDLADKAIYFRKKLAGANSDKCKYCEEVIIENKHLLTQRQIINSLMNCECSSSTPLLIHAEYQIAMDGSIDDCNKFLVKHSSTEYTPKIKEQLAKLEELKFYNNTIGGSILDCNSYLSKYPNGQYTSKVNATKSRLISVERSSNPSSWSQGDRICNSENSNGVIQAVIEQWNDKRTKLKVKIIAGYEGMYQGEDIFKGNMIWIMPNGWYKCIGDEIVNYDIQTGGANGIVDRNKYKYTIGDLVKCRNWANGKAGYNASVLDKKEGKYLVKVTEVFTSGIFSTNLNPSACSGQLRLKDYKEYIDDEGVGSIFWASKSCFE